ncbi:MAG: response regulator [Gammaproteobacteria bacterium]|nr:response regulator [Gammaproteobacteria bacterium]
MLPLKYNNDLSTKNIVNGIALLILLWTLCISASLAWNIYNTHKQAHQHAKEMALNSFNRDQALRQWIAEHEGIYILNAQNSEENGKESFILLDPATFLKKVMERFPENFDSSIRMIGFNPFNKTNLPNALETAMLNGFLKGDKQYIDYRIIENHSQLGLFKPMRAHKNCLSCHAALNFEEGDLIGAAGVYINLHPFTLSAKKLRFILVITHLIIWAFGYIIIVLYGKKTEENFKAHEYLEQQLAQSHSDLEIRVEERTLELSKLSQALQQSPVLVIITNEKGLIEYVNPYFSQITGYTDDEILGKNPSLLKSSFTSEATYKELWATINKDSIWSGELCNLRKDGSQFWVSASIGAFFSDTDKILGYIAVEQDISYKKEVEYNLIQEKERAEQANKTKSEFLASMSHELRTPLNAIIGFAQLAELDDNISEQQKSNSSEIYSAGKHLLSLINDILDLSAIESGRVKLHMKHVQYEAIIKECYKLIQPIALEKQITLDFSNYICNCEVEADYLRLKQVLLNLLSNAIKYTERLGRVQLECNGDMPDHIIINITDNGDGISPENLTHLFKPFERLGMENSSIQGTGIGLVISKKLIKMMNGDITVKSTVGEGSTFSIILPKSTLLSDDSMIVEDPIKAFLPVQQNKKINIFYVEDNVANLTLMKNIIAHQNGWNLRYSETAEEGIERIKQKQPDIILMDINLPGMNGIEACQIIKMDKQLKHIPIIAVSAVATKIKIERAIEAGFDHYITKPIDIKNLIQTIISSLEA